MCILKFGLGKKIFLFLSAFIIFYSSQVMNLLFYADYDRYEPSLNRAYSANNEIESIYCGQTQNPLYLWKDLRSILTNRFRDKTNAGNAKLAVRRQYKGFR